ncbi:MAG: hypothetical protein ACJ77U_05825, partial [Chloroflexota bacterium]
MQLLSDSMGDSSTVLGARAILIGVDPMNPSGLSRYVLGDDDIDSTRESERDRVLPVQGARS